MGRSGVSISVVAGTSSVLPTRISPDRGTESFASATPSAGVGYELQVLTAVLLGGASLTGGEGRVTRTFIGVLIISVINNGMTLLSVPSYYQTIANGALLLVAVAIDQFRTKAGYR